MRIFSALILSLMVFPLTISGMAQELSPAKADSKHPLRAIEVTFANDLREQYVSQLRMFAESYAFEISVTQKSPDPDHILVQLWRDDVELISVILPDRKAQDLTYFIGIYENGDHPIPMTVVDDLVQNLRNAAIQVEGATFTITK